MEKYNFKKDDLGEVPKSFLDEFLPLVRAAGFNPKGQIVQGYYSMYLMNGSKSVSDTANMFIIGNKHQHEIDKAIKETKERARASSIAGHCINRTMGASE